MCEYVVQRTTANLPQSAASDLFSVSGGKVLLLGLVGEVTSAITMAASSTGVSVGTTEVWGANIAGLGAGSLFGGDGQSRLGQVEPMAGFPLVATDVTISIATTTTSTGQIRWTLWYKPLDPGASVVAV